MPTSRAGKRAENSARGVQGSENILFATTVGNTCHYTFVKTRRVYDTKNEP